MLAGVPHGLTQQSRKYFNSPAGVDFLTSAVKILA